MDIPDSLVTHTSWSSISFDETHNHRCFRFYNTGQIGDTIGGITGPVIALIVGLLTFLAFWVQFQSNKAQTYQFKKQDTDTKVDRFETRFYELLQLHRDNVSEMSVGNSEGEG